MSESPSYIEALRQMTLRYERLVQALSILRRMDELDDPRRAIEAVFRGTLERIAFGMAAENCSLMLLDDSGERLELRAACSPFEEKGRFFEPGQWDGCRFAKNEGIVGKVFSSGEAIRIEDVQKHPDFLQVENSQVEIRSILCFPLKVNERITGVLNLSHSSPGFFTLESEHILAFVAERAARIFESHALRQSLKSPVLDYGAVGNIHHLLSRIQKNCQQTLEEISEETKAYELQKEILQAIEKTAPDIRRLFGEFIPSEKES